jgi:hypothetical protein
MRIRSGQFLGAGLVLLLLTTTASAQVYSFSNCGATGRLGPSQSDCNTAYTATPLAGNVTVTGGIQAWTVPVTGIYRIEGAGAQGGDQVYAGGFAGSAGARIAGDFLLNGGETIYVIVGQRGGNTREDGDPDIDNAAPGGGGGSFVYRDASDPLPLIAAGGGGSGARCSSVSNSERIGQSGEAGGDSGSVANGGTNGNGGRNNVGGSSYWAGGGSGWLTDGTGGDNAVNYDYTPVGNAAEGGRAPRNGALGGTRWNDGYDEGGDGGFGGGGGGGSDNMGGGGGGGFSGGGGANYEDCGNEPGGGGGSYNGGDNALNEAGANTGQGYVTISAVRFTNPVPTASTWALMLLGLAIAIGGVVTLGRH